MLYFLAKPSAKPDLRHQLRAGATYATLAAVFGSWRPSTLEMLAHGRGTPNRSNSIKPLSHGFFHYLRGGLPRQKTIEGLCEKLVRQRGARAAKPAADLMWHWWHHPLAELLCIPSDGHDHVLKQLEHIPVGPARDCVWQYAVTTMGAEIFRKEIPDTRETINKLVEMADYPALLTLVGKMRLRQLQGRFEEYDNLYEQAIWKILPWAISSSAQLSLARGSVVAAVCHFLSWSPYADMRFRERSLNCPYRDLEELEREIDRCIGISRLRGVNMPPVELECGKTAIDVGQPARRGAKARKQAVST